MNQLSSLSNYWHIAMMVLSRFTGWKWMESAGVFPKSWSQLFLAVMDFKDRWWLSHLSAIINDQGCSKPFEVNHGHFFGGKMARLTSLTSHVSEYLGCWEQRWLFLAYIKWDTLFYTVVDIYTVVYICTSTDMYISISLYALKVYQQDSVGYCLGFVCFLIMSYFRATPKT